MELLKFIPGIKFKKIMYKFSIPIVIFDCIVTMILASYFINYSLSDINAGLQNKMDLYSAIIKGVANSVSKVDNAQTDTIFKSLWTDKDVVFLKVFDISGKSGALQKMDRTWELPKGANVTNVTFDIVIPDNVKVGEVSIGLTDYYMRAKFTNELWRIGILLLLIIISIMGAGLIIGRQVARPILNVASRLSEIAKKNEVDLDQKLQVNSNDEVGMLVGSFNEIIDKFKHQVDLINSHNELIVQQEKMASLGTLIGGIAHNLKTPLLTVSGSIEAINNLVNEYKSSITDTSVTADDHYEIANDMYVRIDRIKKQCAYMTDVITAVREQVANSSDSLSKFYVKDGVNRVSLLLSSELKKHKCELDITLDLEENVCICGDVGAFVQIINNLVINAMHAYEGAGGKIRICGERSDDKIAIKVIDYAKGIPESIKKKIFKEMVTTKGKDGSGIGLYVSYSSIKSNFKGDMMIESEEGKGTTIIILLNEYKGVNF